MKFTKKNIRSTFKSNRRNSFGKINNSFSNHKMRFKGNISQMHEKYTDLAKEALSSGDRIQSEYYFQFADHYSRLMVENNLKSTNLEEDSKRNYKTASEHEDKENTELVDNNNKENNVDKSFESKDENQISDSSISSVPFIARPTNKTTKLKK